MLANRLVAVGWLLLSLVLVATTAGAVSEEERSFLTLYFSDDELEILSATRSLKAVASVAENVAVVTAAEIELMNAHTVAEALYNVTGIEIMDFKGPGSVGNAAIHGSGTDRVTVMLDGVPLSSANNSFQLATLPVQMVKKIEIIKGPASSAWGSSFGGVINVVTKSVESGDHVGGTLSASIGESGTSDVRVETHARKDRLGIYLYGGRMDSDGILDGRRFTHDNFFGKVNFDAGRKSRVDVSFYYHNSDSVHADFQPAAEVYDAFSLETLYGKADFQSALADRVDLKLSAWRLRSNDNFYASQLGTDIRTRDTPIRYDRYGFNGSLGWRTGDHALVAGADVTNEHFEREFAPYSTLDQRNYALFVNDTIFAGDLTVTPGLRYDHASLAGGLASPSLGATWLASRDLLLRVLVSRGFHDPAIVRYIDAPAQGYQASDDLKPERIWSYQAGVETNVADLLRAKLTFFYHDIDDILIENALEPGKYTMENAGRARTAGGELEIATNSFNSFVFKSGVHYERIELIDFSDPLYFDVRDVLGVNATLAYDAEKGLSGTAKAHYAWWDMTEPWMADSGGVVVDLSITKRFLNTGKIALELFADARNLFNAHSYSNQLHRNPGRWGEVGMRCTF